MEYRAEVRYTNLRNGMEKVQEHSFLSDNEELISQDYEERFINVTRDTFIENECDYITVKLFGEDGSPVDDGADYDLDDYGGARAYFLDKREITIEKLEELLCEKFGGSDYCRSAGCYHGNNGWFSINSILEYVSNNI